MEVSEESELAENVRILQDGRMPYSDPEKAKQYKSLWNKRHYRENIEKEKERIFGRRREIERWYKEYKSKLSCSICKESTTACLDFHHKDKRTKDLSVANFRQRGWSAKRIQGELEKCVVVCANCHRKIHAGLIKI